MGAFRRLAPVVKGEKFKTNSPARRCYVEETIQRRKIKTEIATSLSTLLNITSFFLPLSKSSPSAFILSFPLQGINAEN